MSNVLPISTPINLTLQASWEGKPFPDDDGMRCIVLAPISPSPVVQQIGPVLVPPVALPGATVFNMTYVRNAQISPARFSSLVNDINNYIGHISQNLGPLRNYNDPSKRITLNGTVRFESISMVYSMTITFKIPDNPLLPIPHWVVRVTKTNSGNVLVKEIILNHANPSVFPEHNGNFFLIWNSINSAPNAPRFQLMLGNQLVDVNGDIDNSYNSPPGPFFPLINGGGSSNGPQPIYEPPFPPGVDPNYHSSKFRWYFVPTIMGVAIPYNPQYNLDGGISGSTPRIPPDVDFYFSTSTGGLNNTVYVDRNIAYSNEPFRIASRPMQGFIFSQPNNIQTSNPELFDCTGVNLPMPSTPFPTQNGRTNSATPFITSAQYRFLRIYDDWAPFTFYVDQVITPTSQDFEMIFNTDYDFLEIGTKYDFNNSYVSISPFLYSFKGLFTHHLLHCLAFKPDFIYFNPLDSTKYSAPLMAHYLFPASPLPQTPSDFENFTRSSVSNQVVLFNGNSNLFRAMDPRFPGHYSSVATPNVDAGLMSPFFPKGNLVPIGTGPSGGLSTNDKFGLLCGCIAQSDLPVCVDENTRVLTNSGEKYIKDIVSGDLVLNHKHEWTQVKKNHDMVTYEFFVVFPPNTIAVNVPNRELLICPGHTILVNGIELKCEELIGHSNHQFASVYFRKNVKSIRRINTLITERREFIEMQGMLVGTWAADAWDNYEQNDAKMKVCIDSIMMDYN